MREFQHGRTRLDGDPLHHGEQDRAHLADVLRLAPRAGQVAREFHHEGALAVPRARRGLELGELGAHAGALVGPAGCEPGVLLAADDAPEHVLVGPVTEGRELVGLPPERLDAARAPGDLVAGGALEARADLVGELGRRLEGGDGLVDDGADGVLADVLAGTGATASQVVVAPALRRNARHRPPAAAPDQASEEPLLLLAGPPATADAAPVERVLGGLPELGGDQGGVGAGGDDVAVNDPAGVERVAQQVRDAGARERLRDPPAGLASPEPEPVRERGDLRQASARSARGEEGPDRGGVGRRLDDLQAVGARDVAVADGRLVRPEPAARLPRHPLADLRPEVLGVVARPPDELEPHGVDHRGRLRGDDEAVARVVNRQGAGAHALVESDVRLQVPRGTVDAVEDDVGGGVGNRERAQDQGELRALVLVGGGGLGEERDDLEPFARGVGADGVLLGLGREFRLVLARDAHVGDGAAVARGNLGPTSTRHRNTLASALPRAIPRMMPKTKSCTARRRHARCMRTQSGQSINMGLWKTASRIAT